MNVKRAYYQVPGGKMGRDASSRRTTNLYHNPLTAVYTKGTLVPSETQAAYAKPYTQPKIMSPANCSSTQRSNCVTCLSIIPREMFPKVVVLPSIDRDITAPSARSVSLKNSVVTSADRTIGREARTTSKASKPQAKKYVSCLHTALSTEWRKDSVDQESYRKDKKQRTTSLRIEFNNKTKTTPTTAASVPSFSRVGDKRSSRAEPHRPDPDLTDNFLNCKNCEVDINMNSQTVRVQCLPASGKSFTIKDTIRQDGYPRSETRANTSAISARSAGQPRQGLRPRMLPKSRFRVKIQKCHHKSLNISDAYADCVEGNREKILVKESKSVVVQQKSPQRSFSVQRHNS